MSVFSQEQMSDMQRRLQALKMAADEDSDDDNVQVSPTAKPAHQRAMLGFAGRPSRADKAPARDFRPPTGGALG